MPYKDNDSLPDAIKKALPADVQSIWRNAFNSAHKKDPDEEKANKTAWGAVKNAGWQKEGDKWVKKESNTHEFDAEIFSSGTWNGDKYTDEDLDAMITAFSNLQESVKPPVKLGHNEKQMKDGNPALGWVKSLKRVGNKLIATLSQVPDVVYTAIKRGLYKRISSEIFWNYKHDGKTFKRVLAGVALIGADVPAVTNLKDLEAYLSQSTGKGLFDTIRAYAFDTDDAGQIINHIDKKEFNKMEEKEYKAKIAKLETDLEKEKAEKKDYADRAEKIEQEREVEQKKSRSKEIKSYCEQTVKDGKMLPYQRDILVNEIDKRTYSAKEGFSFDFETMKKLFEKIDKIIDLKEHAHGKKEGEGKKKYANVSEELHVKTEEYRLKNKVDYSEAMNAVLVADKDLAERYTKGD